MKHFYSVRDLTKRCNFCSLADLSRGLKTFKAARYLRRHEGNPNFEIELIRVNVSVQLYAMNTASGFPVLVSTQFHLSCFT